MNIMETAQLALREMTEDDVGFYLEMLTDPGFKANIADRGVRSEEDALTNLRDRVFTSYDVHGFGMYLVTRKSDGEAIGMAGLVKRDFLDNVDVGYAFLPRGRGQGFATEAVTNPMLWYDADGSQEKLRENLGKMIASCKSFLDLDRVESHPLTQYLLD